MDDLLETPSSLLPNLSSSLPHEEEQQSDEEEGGLDWTKLVRSSTRPVIPKRGEKEYEPRAAGGTNLQIHVLDQSRNAMFETLRTTRSISSKAVSYAIWHPDIVRTEVTVARGIHFGNMGHSAPRLIAGEDGVTKAYKRLELLPEEAIYLIERGALFCWKGTSLALSQIPGLNDLLGSPMSVQQAYDEMIGTEGITLEKFQVFSYLKRLGYVVTRANPPDPYYPTPPNQSRTTLRPSIMDRIKSLFASWKSIFYRVFFREFNWWKPLRISRWLHHDKNYTSILSSLRFIPAGHDVKLIPSNITPKTNTSYQVFYHIYKPSTPFKKSSPPPPDFHVVVVNARTTPLPTLEELTNLFVILPEMPIPSPRPRRSQPFQGSSKSTTDPDPQSQRVSEVMSSSSCSAPSSPGSHVWALIQRLFFSKTDYSSPRPNTNVKPNPFVALKAGKKAIIIAAVDMGNISFYKFGQGEFSEWPMV